MYQYLRFPDFRLKTLTLSYDDGPIFDRRLIEIMSRHGLRGTFNLNSGRAVDPTDPNRRSLTVEEAVSLVLESGNEVAVHGFKHLSLSTIPELEALRDVVDDRIALERLCGAPVRGMAYAYGAYNDAVVDLLGKAGIRYSRTVHSTERFDIPTDWLRLPATCHHKCPRLDALCDEFLAIEELKATWRNSPRLFYLWGHSYEFNDDDNWQIIERFAERMGGRDDIWYATNIEIYDYVMAYHALEFSLDGKTVYNPTATDVYLAIDGRRIIAKSGVVTPIR